MEYIYGNICDAYHYISMHMAVHIDIWYTFVVGGLGFEFWVFVAGWRHALRSEWPFIIIHYTYMHGCSTSVAG